MRNRSSCHLVFQLDTFNQHISLQHVRLLLPSLLLLLLLLGGGGESCDEIRLFIKNLDTWHYAKKKRNKRYPERVRCYKNLSSVYSSCDSY